MKKLIASIQSKHYPIEVWQSQRTRWMCFANANIQTAMDLREPHQLVLDYMAPMLGVLHFLPDAQHCCLLGLGGGAIVRFLQHDYPAMHVTAVDIEQTIIDVATEYFELPSPSATFAPVCDDARHYLQQTEAKFDVLLVDLYSAEELPAFLNTAEFFSDCQQQLTDSGILVCNLLGRSKAQLRSIIKLIRDVFDHRTLCVDVVAQSNIVVYAFNDAGYSKRVTQFAEDGILAGVKLDFELGVIAEGIGEL